MAPTLTHDQIRAIYDRLGARQDWQGFYEYPSTANLIGHARLGDIRSLFKFGCGTERLAASLLAGHLRDHCRYLAIDSSPIMVRLAREKLKQWSGRAEVHRSDGTMELSQADSSFDCFLSTYVLDLLSEADIRRLMAEAHRILSPGGRVGLVSLTWGGTPLARLVSHLWSAVHSATPWLVGGCRPLRLMDYLPRTHWRTEYRNVVGSWGVSSEIIVACRRETANPRGGNLW